MHGETRRISWNILRESVSWKRGHQTLRKLKCNLYALAAAQIDQSIVRIQNTSGRSKTVSFWLHNDSRDGQLNRRSRSKFETFSNGVVYDVIDNRIFNTRPVWKRNKYARVRKISKVAETESLFRLNFFQSLALKWRATHVENFLLQNCNIFFQFQVYLSKTK